MSNSNAQHNNIGEGERERERASEIVLTDSLRHHSFTYSLNCFARERETENETVINKTSHKQLQWLNKRKAKNEQNKKGNERREQLK